MPVCCLSVFVPWKTLEDGLEIKIQEYISSKRIVTPVTTYFPGHRRIGIHEWLVLVVSMRCWRAVNIYTFSSWL